MSKVQSGFLSNRQFLVVLDQPPTPVGGKRVFHDPAPRGDLETDGHRRRPVIGRAADLAPGPVASPCAASDCYAGMSYRASNGLDARCGHGKDATFRHHETAFGVGTINTWFHHGMREGAAQRETNWSCTRGRFPRRIVFYSRSSMRISKLQRALFRNAPLS